MSDMTFRGNAAALLTLKITADMGALRTEALLRGKTNEGAIAWLQNEWRSPQGLSVYEDSIRDGVVSLLTKTERVAA